MNSVIAKIDDDTLRALDEISQGKSRSEIIRTALRQYIARHKLEERKRQVEEYMRTSREREEMSSLAEADITHAAELLQKAEEE